MLASVHIADLNVGSAIRCVLRRPKPPDVPGLIVADTAMCAPLSLSGPPPASRPGLIAFWKDDASIDAFVASHPIGRRLDGGFHARLEPLRAYGTWPGLPADVSGSRAPTGDGPVVVLTLGRLRMSRLVRFVRTSRPAEAAALAHPGLVWGTAATRPPFVATVSIWESAEASANFAFGREHPAHSDAIDEQRRKDFHRQSAFIRCRPVRMEGTLDGTNPLRLDDQMLGR